MILGLYTRWFDDWALLIGWAVGVFTGTAMAAAMNFSATYSLTIAGVTMPGYTAFYTVILNLVVAVVLTPVFRAMASRAPVDETVAADYLT